MPKQAEQAEHIWPSRDEYRKNLLKSRPGKTIQITFFGMVVELRQPPLGVVLDYREQDDLKTRSADMLVKYCYVPGTDERIFEEGDKEGILALPYGEDMMRIQTAITELTGIEVEGKAKELAGDPLEE